MFLEREARLWMRVLCVLLGMSAVNECWLRMMVVDVWVDVWSVS